MKANQSSKSRNMKTAIRVLTIFVCISIAFSLIVVQQSEALLGILLVIGAVFVGGILIGWWTASKHDSTTPDAIVTSQENYVAVWNDFIEEWNNDYIDENTDLHNFMMMYNLTYLDSVRRAEHDIASYVHFEDWLDVENNMTTLIQFKENITKFIVSTLHGYNRIEVSILQHTYDTDNLSYTTPMKYAKRVYDTTGNISYANIPLSEYGHIGDYYYQYKVNFGTHPVGYDGDYEIGDKFYVTYLYVPSDRWIELTNLDSSINTTYYEGVYDIQGERCEVTGVIKTYYSDAPSYANDKLDNTGVYLFGVPIDFNPLVDTFRTYNTGLESTTGRQTILFEKSKYIDKINISFYCPDSYFVTLYIDGSWTQAYSFTSPSYDIVTLQQNVTNITTIAEGTSIGGITSILTKGYVYHDMTGGLKVVTDDAGTCLITEQLDARGRVGLDWMVDSYISIYDAMILNAQILWNLYHSYGWYSTDDIPSEYIVVPPDIIFDNMDALQNLPPELAQAIYYAWMKQLIDFYDENPDYTGSFDDTNITVFDDGIIFNATLIHGGQTIFTNHLIYISPLLEDLYLCKNNSYNLTQKIFIYDITGNYVYYGYINDSLTIQNITIEGVETDCVTLGRQTMHDFLLGKYGFSISFPAEWEFPEIVDTEIYMGIAIACFGFGIPIAIFGKKYRPIGYLLIVIGSGIIIYVYVIPAIQSFIDYIIFWD